MSVAGIVIDEWKLPIFKRHLEQSGYTFEISGHFTPDTLVLRVNTINIVALGVVVKAANNEAAQTGAPQ